MKRLEEILKTHCPSMDRLFLDDKGLAFREKIFNAMRDYAREVAQASLEKAAENAVLKSEIKSRKDPNIRYGTGSYKETSVDKESITNPKNITLL
ncbi:hypothetical protein HZP39_04205 [Elizabethkingia anophelis]|nr:hypothetical protein [Elizabethkingia anophelis]MCT4239427.1 hypothetical protein [Elizabethkingia anophelis]MCT4282002.1 hypothetical protein [Elizabethkingia anophelis]MCT4292587.1 hypothetical protein [Elizabethkingia anophelis]